MKIGIYSPYFDTTGGGERYMLTVASCLSKDHDVDIFWDNEKNIRKAQRNQSIDLKRVNIVNNIFGRSYKLYKKMRTTQQYDLIITLSDGSIPFSFAKANILHFQQPFQNVSGRSIINKLKLRNYSAIICNSKFTKEFIDQEFGVSSTVLYPPVATSKFSSKKKEKIILSVGRFHNVKKHSVMIRAFAKLRLKDWKLNLVGSLLDQDKDYYQKLKQKAENIERVTLFPNAPFNKLVRQYERASVYWHAAGYGEDESKRPERFEHFGIAPVEAMASGCMPIIYNGGGLPEIVTDGENGFLWKSIDELIGKTFKVIKDESLRSKLTRQARIDARKFSVQRFCNSIYEFIG